MNRFVLVLLFLLLALLAFVLLRPPRSAPPPPPAAATAAERSGLESAPIHAMRERGNEYLVRNLVHGPIQVTCRLERAVNLRTDPPLPRSLVLPSRSERSLASIHILDPTLPNAAGAVVCAGMIGDPRARPREDHHYALPFARGTEFSLQQGFGGRFSHVDAENRHALDLGVPEGTPVLAARAGVVMQVEESFREHGTELRFGDRANFVRVLHEDGSMAVYAHLAPESMLRRPGDRVVVGQLVGKSGNTGLSTGPHLHFSVQRNAGMALVSIPFAMEGIDPAAARD